MKKPYANPEVRSQRVVFTVGELAKMAGVSKYRVEKLLAAEGVPVRSRGARRVRTVCLCHLKRAWPDFWDSIVLRASLADLLERGSITQE